MAREITAQRYYESHASFRMLDAEVKDFYISGLGDSRLESYEPPISEFFVRCARLLNDRPWCFLDVGANTGIYSLAVAAVAEQARCFAYEPVKAIYDILRSNIDLNSELAKRISAINLAVSNASGTTTFHETANTYGFVSTSSSIEAPPPSAGEHHSYPVEIIALDEQAYPSPVDLIKIDVEGHEPSVFGGARKLIAGNRPVIVFEVLNSATGHSFNAFAREANYRFFGLSKSGFRTSSHFLAAETTNYIACPVEREAFVFSILIDMNLRFLRT